MIHTNGFFEGVGETIGEAISALVTGLLSLSDGSLGAFEDFIRGLAGSLGISPSFFSILVLVVGLWVLWRGISALLRGSLLGAIVRIVLGLMILSWLLT
ncbi:MAG: hypothetical protein ACQES7_08780 [Pseudomonadota bacterium]